MNKTEKLLISIIRANICDGRLEDNIDINDDVLKELYVLAKKHGILNIISDLLISREFISNGEIKQLFYNSLLSSVAFYEKMKYEINKMYRLFEENEIVHMPLKGAVIRKYYREPWLRNSCDIDILIKPEDLERATDILEKNNYEIVEKAPHDWGFIAKNGIKLELHFKLIEERLYNDGPLKYNWNVKCLDNVWDSASLVENKKYQYAMSDEMFYFYHIAHMAKHMEHCGCGIRFFLDLWILNNKNDNYDKRISLINTSGLGKFEQAARSLSEVWFSEKTRDNVSDLLEKFVLDSGCYGSPTNHVKIYTNKNGNRLKYILHLIFLSKNLMEKKYPILVKQKWLYPVFHVVRWISILCPSKNKKSRTIADIKESLSNSREDISEIGELFSLLGLKK